MRCCRGVGGSQQLTSPSPCTELGSQAVNHSSPPPRLSPLEGSQLKLDWLVGILLCVSANISQASCPQPSLRGHALSRRQTLSLSEAVLETDLDPGNKVSHIGGSLLCLFPSLQPQGQEMLSGRQENADCCQPSSWSLPAPALSSLRPLHPPCTCSGLFKVSLPGPFLFSCLTCSLGVLTSRCCPSPPTI